MSKKSSYQKLKAEIFNLNNDIRTMLKDEKSAKSIMLKAKYRMQFDMEDSVLYGGREVKYGHGILHYINRMPETYSQQPNLDADDIIRQLKAQQP